MLNDKCNYNFPRRNAEINQTQAKAHPKNNLQNTGAKMEVFVGAFSRAVFRQEKQGRQPCRQNQNEVNEFLNFLIYIQTCQ